MHKRCTCSLTPLFVFAALGPVCSQWVSIYLRENIVRAVTKEARRRLRAYVRDVELIFRYRDILSEK